MKEIKKIAILGAVLALVFAIAFASCGDGTPSAGSVSYKSSDATNTYELVVTQNTAKAVYTPQIGDTYVLTITPIGGGSPVKSVGTVSAIDGNDLTLQPSANGAVEFTVTAANGEMTKITGTITKEDGTTVSAPAGNLTPETSGGGGNGSVTLSGTYYNMSWYQTRAEYAAELTAIGYGSKNGALADLIACGAPELMKKDAITFSGSTCTRESYRLTGDFSGGRGDDGYWPITSLLYEHNIKDTMSYHVVGNNIWTAGPGIKFDGNLGEPSYVLSADGYTLTDVRQISIGVTTAYTKK